MNKSAMRKSRPVHIPQQQQNMDHVATSHTVQHLPSDGRRISSPPPLMRGPPPLIRFQDNQSISQASIFDCACMGIDAIAGPGILTGRF
jgi:hypothetical protein